MKRFSKDEQAALGRMAISKAIWHSPLVSGIVDELRRAKKKGRDAARARSAADCGCHWGLVMCDEHRKKR